MQQRIAIVHRMQEIIYDETPYIVLVYPNELEGYNRTAWTGWQRSLGGKGKVWFDALPGLYMNIQKSAAVPQKSSSNTAAIIAGVVAAVVVVALVVLVLVRRGRRRVEEA